MAILRRGVICGWGWRWYAAALFIWGGWGYCLGMARILIIPSLVLLLLGGVAFWFSGGGGGGGDTIVIATGDDIKTLDPGAMSWQNDIRIALGLWEGLVTYEPQTLRPLPGVAERWETSADGLEWTFHLRPEARWSNGDAVTARDFIFAWKRCLTPATAAEYLTLFYYIRGAEAYYRALDAKQPADFAQVGIVAPDAHTLRVTLRAPCAFLLDLLAFAPFLPLHEASMAKFLNVPGDVSGGYSANWTRPPGLVSNGPFVLSSWSVKRELVLTANPYYWDRANVGSPRLRFTPIADHRAAYLAYQGGAVDVMTWVPPGFGPELLKEQQAGLRKDVHFQPVFGTYYWIFNHRQAPFTDVRVRKALTLAIDRQKITRDVTRLGQIPCLSLTPPGAIPGYTAPAGVAEDIKTAQAELAAAGYPGGQGLPELEFLYNTEGAHGLVAQAVAAMWQEHLGVRVRLRAQDRATFSKDRRQQNFQLCRSGWYGDYLDPTTFLFLFRSDDGNNDGKYNNPAFDALLRQADATVDPAARMGLLRQAEAILVEQDFALIPLYVYSDGMMFDAAKIGGLELNAKMLMPLKGIRRVKR